MQIFQKLKPRNCFCFLTKCWKNFCFVPFFSQSDWEKKIQTKNLKLFVRSLASIWTQQLTFVHVASELPLRSRILFPLENFIEKFINYVNQRKAACDFNGRNLILYIYSYQWNEKAKVKNGKRNENRKSIEMRKVKSKMVESEEKNSACFIIQKSHVTSMVTAYWKWILHASEMCSISTYVKWLSFFLSFCFVELECGPVNWSNEQEEKNVEQMKWRRKKNIREWEQIIANV